MSEHFAIPVRFSKSEKIFQFNNAGKLEESDSFIAPICPACRKREHPFVFDNTTIWCCANDCCMEERINNAGVQGNVYPLNFMSHLRKRNAFCSAALSKDGICDDFVEKWTLLKDGKIKDILLIGMYGTGKTHCMYAALREVCRFAKGMSALFLTETELYEKVKNTWDKSSKLTEQEVLKRIASADFLFLDDLGSASRSSQGEWAKQILLDILDERLNSLSHRTIISSNFALDSGDNNHITLFDIYGPRIADRLKFLTTAILGGQSRRSPMASKDSIGTA